MSNLMSKLQILSRPKWNSEQAQQDLRACHAIQTQDLRPSIGTSQLALRLHQRLYLGELIVVVQALLVGQCIGRLDCFARYDLFHRQFNFLEIDGRLGK